MFFYNALIFLLPNASGTAWAVSTDYHYGKIMKWKVTQDESIYFNDNIVNVFFEIYSALTNFARQRREKKEQEKSNKCWIL